MSFYPRLNDIYITQRLKHRLTVIGSASITTVIAPMGFGKTTAITWWMKQQNKYHPDWVILRQMIDTPSITDFWTASAGRCGVIPHWRSSSRRWVFRAIPRPCPSWPS